MPREFTKKAVVRLGRDRTFRRTFPAVLGGAQFYASTEGSLKLLHRDPRRFDEDLLPLARAHVRRGAVVWDVGANVGVFAFAAAGLAGASGRVVAVDADIWCAGTLRRSATLNVGRDVAPVDVLPVALADLPGVQRFVIAKRSRATNHLASTSGSPYAEGSRSEILVPTLNLNIMAEHFPLPDVLKIDAEGAEPLILRGSSRFFTLCRPILILETDEHIHADLMSALSPYGYSVPEWRSLGAGRSHTIAITVDDDLN